jgi:SAM-dependent methyltransferase
MASIEPTPSDVHHWDAFWRARATAVAQDHIGARDPAPAEFWAAHLRQQLEGRKHARLIDVACGNGAVTRIAMEAARAVRADLAVHCADYSVSAVREACTEFPEARGVACDACNIPYADRSFDLVVSQFGLEYAGAAAFPEAARLVAGDGLLTAVVHMESGAIHEECAENHAVVEALDQSRLLPLARDAFNAGFDVLEGRIGNAEFQEHDRRLAPAVEIAKAILRDKGPLAAGGLLANVYRDIAYMYGRIPNYSREDIMAWFDGVSAELKSYSGRMASMTRVAVDEAAIARISDALRALGFEVADPSQLSLKSIPRPSAWILTAQRSS